MTLVGIEVATNGEDAVRTLLMARLDSAYRLATCILRDTTAAEDAVQEAAARAWSMRRGLREPDRAEAWFSRIVVNVCRAELARRSSAPRIGELDLVAAGEIAGLRRGGDQRDQRDLESRDEVARALARLTSDEQIVLAMRYGRDLTVPQIAEHTGLREGTVKSRLHGALEHMRAAFEAERRAEEVLR
jgi:RNA polymerase sigma-70 factor, ECF subfamily